LLQHAHVSCHVSAAVDLYALSLHDALPIWLDRISRIGGVRWIGGVYRVHGVGATGITPIAVATASGLRHHGQRDGHRLGGAVAQDRKSTRLNSSHVSISYAVVCLQTQRLAP